MSWYPGQEVIYGGLSTDANNAPVRALLFDAGPMAIADQVIRPGIIGVQFYGTTNADIPIPDYRKPRQAKQSEADQSPQLPQNAGMLKAGF